MYFCHWEISPVPRKNIFIHLLQAQIKCHAHKGLCLCLCGVFSRFRWWILKRSIPKVWGTWSFRLCYRTISCSPLPFSISPLKLCSCLLILHILSEKQTLHMTVMVIWIYLISHCSVSPVPWNQRMGRSPHGSWVSQRPRLSKHYFLSSKHFYPECSLTQRCCHWWYIQSKPSGNGLLLSHVTSPHPVSQLVLIILQLNIPHYEPLRQLLHPSPLHISQDFAIIYLHACVPCSLKIP